MSRSTQNDEPIPARAAPALLVLCAPFATLGIWLTNSKGLQSLAAFAASLALAMFVAAMCARTWRRFFLMQFPVVLLSAAFATFALVYGTVPGDFIAYVLATSSWDEFRGYFSIWAGQRLLLGAAALTGIYLALVVWAPPRAIFPCEGSRTRLVCLGAVIVLLAIAAPRQAALIDGVVTNPVIGTAVFVAGPLARARAGVKGTAVVKVPYRASGNHALEVHVLVIGESARRDSWSVYGYERKTTPYLEKLRGEAVFFQNAVTDANITISAVPILLTGMSPDHFDMRSIKGNLLDLAEEGGYSTSWLMNQDPHISLLIGIHADRMVYPPSLSTLTTGRLPLDETLLPELRLEIARAGHARFIGVHVIGSHWMYGSRYPAAFERFGSGQGLTYMSVLSQKSDPRVLNAYDNSVLYTDWFLEQIIEAARKLPVPATVTFFADHGEDLYALDGDSGHGTPGYSRHQFDIPAFVWMNAAYRDAHPDKVHALLANADKEIRSHNVFQSMADLMGIHWPGAMASMSFASPDFVPDSSSPLIAGGTLVTRPD